LTQLCCVPAATSLFAVLAILLGSAGNFKAQTSQRATSLQAMHRPNAVARRPTRQQRKLITHNEAGAIATLQTLFSAEATYQSTIGNGDYGTIEELRKEQLIDYVLAEGHRYGYLFRIRREKFSTESQASFELVAVPRTYGRTGRHSFYMNETGVIHAMDKNGAEANLGDDPVVIDP
jgi:hypothetical protein